LPDVYLQQKASYVRDFPDAEKVKYLEHVLQDRDTLRQKIKELIASYSEQRCGQAGLSRR
jgi:hypothetical protein